MWVQERNKKKKLVEIKTMNDEDEVDYASLINVRLFIEKIEENPVIWNPNVPQEKGISKKDAWAKIGNEFFENFMEAPRRQQAQIGKRIHGNRLNLTEI